ncbi:MAG: CubicO group peptidase (beta-lactamase class C family) [Limisphaerales bacterium]
MRLSLRFSAGALASTVEDLIRWQHALSNDKLLSADSRKLMRTPGTLNDGKRINYGMGLMIRKSYGRRVIDHGGGINGFRSHLAHYPASDHTIVVLANSETISASKLAGLIAEQLFEEKSEPAE